MEQREQSRWRRTIGQLLRWPPTRTQLLWAGGIAALAFLIIVICGYLFGWKWTGLVKDADYHKRTLWDWLQLLIIPAVLAGVGLWFNRQQRAQELQTADRRAQDEALQAYLDQMSVMLIPPSKDLPSLYKARPGDSVSSVARARTLAVLPRLDNSRKGSVLQFLYESGLIAKDRLVLHLKGANLSGANLSSGTEMIGTNLRAAYLSEVNLSKADLSRVNLEYANLSKRATNLSRANLSKAGLNHANLQRTILSGANLSGANMIGTNLRVADLSEANLSRANLSGASLREASLERANLTGAANISDEQLAQCRSLEGATMPDGQKYEDWIKRRGEEDSATPEQRGPWWGGPYHRRGFWRRLFGGS